MSNFYSELVSDERNVNVTLSGIDAEYREPIRTLINGIKKTAFLERHPAYLSLYDGVSVGGWEVDGSNSTISFELRFTHAGSGLSVVFGTSFRGGKQSIHTYLHDRSGRVDRYGLCRYLDVNDCCRVNCAEFNETVNQTKSLAEETARIVSQCVCVLENELSHFVDGSLALGGTDLRYDSADDISARVRKLKEIDLPDVDGHTLLCHAVSARRTDLAQHLLTEGADPNCGAVSLAVNLTSDEETIVTLIDALVEAGADADSSRFSRGCWNTAVDEESESALYAAVRRGNVKVVKCLLRCGAKGKGSESFTSLSPALSQILGASLGRHRVTHHNPNRNARFT